MLGGNAGMQARCGGYLGKPVAIPGFPDEYDFEDCDTTTTTSFVWWSTFFEASDGCKAGDARHTYRTALSHPRHLRRHSHPPLPQFFLLILLSVAECGRVQGLYLT